MNERVFRHIETELLYFLEEKQLIKLYILDGYYEKNKQFDKEAFEHYQKAYDSETDGAYFDYENKWPQPYYKKIANRYGKEQEVVYKKTKGKFKPLLINTKWKHLCAYPLYYPYPLYKDIEIFDEKYEEVTDGLDLTYRSRLPIIGTKQAYTALDIEYRYDKHKKMILATRIYPLPKQLNPSWFINDATEIDFIFADVSTDALIAEHRPHIFDEAGGKDIRLGYWVDTETRKIHKRVLLSTQNARHYDRHLYKYGRQIVSDAKLRRIGKEKVRRNERYIYYYHPTIDLLGFGFYNIIGER